MLKIRMNLSVMLISKTASKSFRNLTSMFEDEVVPRLVVEDALNDGVIDDQANDGRDASQARLVSCKIAPAKPSSLLLSKDLIRALPS